MTGTAGEIVQCPLWEVPKSAAKQASESNAGRHSQSIDPNFVTRAAVRKSPIRAWSSIRGVRPRATPMVAAEMAVETSEEGVTRDPLSPSRWMQLQLFQTVIAERLKWVHSVGGVSQASRIWADIRTVIGLPPAKPELQ